MYSPQAETSDVTAEMADATSKAGDVTDIVTGAAPSSTDAAPSSTEAASGVFKGGGTRVSVPPSRFGKKILPLSLLHFITSFLRTISDFRWCEYKRVEVHRVEGDHTATNR